MISYDAPNRVIQMAYSKFITIEGTEGAGKSTALEFVDAFFTNLNQEFVLTREPGGTELAEEIRKLILYPKSREILEPLSELLLMFAGRAQHISHCILPELRAGKWVISDRYVDASYAYQGGGRGIAIDHIKALDKLIVGDVYPELTLLLDVPADLGLSRTLMRLTTKDRIEEEQIDFFVRVRNTYLKRAKEDPKRIKIIDASLPLPDVEAQINKVLAEFHGAISC